MDVEKFRHWLMSRGAEIFPNTNEYELIRFKGREVGIIYKSGKSNGSYANHAIHCFNRGKKWSGKPFNTGRKNSYRKEKAALLQRDGDICFFCGKPMGDDITLEHLISLSSGGKNALSNMVLCHEHCNQEVKNIPISEKVKYAIANRQKLL